jgi:hypothetical protein
VQKNYSEISDEQLKRTKKEKKVHAFRPASSKKNRKKEKKYMHSDQPA